MMVFFGFGPVPIQKEKLSNGVRLATSRLTAATNARDRMKTGATLLGGYGHQCVDGLSLPNPIPLVANLSSGNRFLAQETFPAGIVDALGDAWVWGETLRTEHLLSA
jgi:hypothetical protein